MISYCIACYRPRYAAELITDLIRKTTAPYEILLWLNINDSQFEHFVQDVIKAGLPVYIVGKTPENIGMAAYYHLFESSRYDMVVQIDDDVICISPHIAEMAKSIFKYFPTIGMIVADVYQDEYTNGSRPSMNHYQLVNEQYQLYEGYIDGWFAIYRKACLSLCKRTEEKFFFLGSKMQLLIQDEMQMSTCLCKHMKVFHVVGPVYASFFGMLDFEINKYTSVDMLNAAESYKNALNTLPSPSDLDLRIQLIRKQLSIAPQWK